MASANFLEEALKSDVDESAVSAIVGTLENQLDQSSTTQVQQVAKNFECGNGGNSINSAIVSNGGTTPIYSAVQQQKHSNHGVANGEIVSNVMNSSSNNNNNNNNNNSKTFIISTSGGQNVINSAGSGAATVLVGKNITVSTNSGGIQPSSTPPALISTVPTVSSSSGINIISNQIVVSAGGPPPPPFHVTTNSISTLNNNNTTIQHQTNMPKNEPVKLVYPAHGGGAGTPNTQAVLNMNNNRVTLTSTALPNGTISLSQAPQLIQTGATGKTTIQATTGGQPGGPGQPQTLIIKNQQTGAVMNSGAPGIVTMSKPINNQITLSALQGQPGSTLLLKNEQGQFQLLRIGPAPTGAQITPANITATTGTNQTIRLQTVPAAQIRPVTQTIVTQNSMVGQTQIRMLTTQSGATTVPRIGQTTIRPAAPVRIQAPLHQQPQHTVTTVASGPRQITAQQIRPNATATVGHTTIVQTSQQLPQTISTTPPALLPHHVSSSMYGDDDINDVAAMGGVNLAEETQRILGSTEFVGTQIRSCKDEIFLHMSALQAKIRGIVARHGLEEPSSEVAVLISHACQERLKNIVEKLAVVAEHRIDIIKVDPRYEVTKDVRGQIKFLEELDKAEQKRHEEQEREMLMRAAKSRSKTEDPEQAKLKAKAKEMQRAEMEELRQRDANLTALQAIGPRKKPKLEEGATTTVTPGASGIGVGVSGKTATPLRPRIKRVNLRDMLFYLEQEKESCRSQMLYKAYLK